MSERRERRAVVEQALPPNMIGRTLGGFEILSKVGEGGMGTVYGAIQTSLGRTVALKILDPRLAAKAELAERFRREARAAAKLDHPHVVQPIDFGEEAGFVFFAMELMEGGSAAKRLDERGPFDEAEAIGVGIAVARALEYAAEQRIVHRDIKPDNILFSKHGTAKLADLGLVLARAERLSQLTAPGVAMGTPHYMSPEQALGQRDLDVRSDIYALGATLYELLTGRTPFHGENAADILTQHVTSSVPDVREFAPRVSPGLAAVIRKMTARRREDRYQTGGELREALQTAAARAGPPHAEGGAAGTAPPGHAPGEAPLEPARRPGSPPAPAGAGERAGGPGATQARDCRGASLRPLPLPPRARRAFPIALAIGVGLVAIGLAIAFGPRLLTRGPGRAAIDSAAEDDAARAIRDLLLARRAADGAYGFDYSVASDPWTTSQAFAALATSSDPPPAAHLGAVLDRIRETALVENNGAAGEAFRGWPASVETADDTACTEASAWAGMALAMAGDRFPEATAADRDHARGFLLSVQALDGGFPSVPAAGAAAVRTSGTAMALAALVMLDAADPRREPEIVAIERAAIWLGHSYDRSRHLWFPNPNRSWGNRQVVHGLSEFVAYSLLEARTHLEAYGRELPAVAREALVDFAASFAPGGVPLDSLDAGLNEDYVFELPPGVRSTLNGVRWVYAPWRLLAAERVARSGDLPRREEWAAEAARVRAAFPELRRSLEEAPPFQIAETFFALNVIRARPAGDPKAGSLYFLIAGRE